MLLMLLLLSCEPTLPCSRLIFCHFLNQALDFSGANILCGGSDDDWKLRDFVDSTVPLEVLHNLPDVFLVSVSGPRITLVSKVNSNVGNVIETSGDILQAVAQQGACSLPG